MLAKHATLVSQLNVSPRCPAANSIAGELSAELGHLRHTDDLLDDFDLAGRTGLEGRSTVIKAGCSADCSALVRRSLRLLGSFGNENLLKVVSGQRRVKIGPYNHTYAIKFQNTSNHF